MESNPLITIITVCFNAVNVIERTILSIINQTYPNVEFIIVDGGSKDSTIDVIRKYDNKISKWISEPDKGIYDAMNKGIKLATGEWINFMNAGDCFSDENVLSKIFGQEYPASVKFLYSDNYYVDEKGKQTYAVHNHNNLSILHQSAIYRKELHEMCGHYIVTPKIIVSDLLFFASVPEEYFKKVDVPISRNLIGGVSSNSWCIDQALCVKVVFRKLTFNQMLVHYISSHIKMKYPVLAKIQKRIKK